MAFRHNWVCGCARNSLTIAAPLVAGAQGRGGGPPLFTPAADATKMPSRCSTTGRRTWVCCGASRNTSSQCRSRTRATAPCRSRGSPAP